MMRGFDYRFAVLALAALCLVSAANTHVTNGRLGDSETVHWGEFVGATVTTTPSANVTGDPTATAKTTGTTEITTAATTHATTDSAKTPKASSDPG